MRERLEIRALGRLSIEKDGQPVTGFESRKVPALLLYLAYTGRPQAREVVGEMLWPERTRAQILNRLGVVLSNLRKTIHPELFLEHPKDPITLNPDLPLWLDVKAFEQGITAALHSDSNNDLAQLETTIALYQGDLLEGHYVNEADFDDWVLIERERLRLLMMDAADNLTKHYLETAHYRQGIQLATRVLQMDNLREQTHRLMMDLLHRSGQRIAALRQYDTLSNALATIDAKPAVSTMQLLETIQQGQPLPEPKPPLSSAFQAISTPYKGLLSFDETDTSIFFGREALVAQLIARLRENEQWARFLAVVGPSGSGKSSAIRAGLLPALRDGALPGSEHWCITNMLPGAQPFVELEDALLCTTQDAPPNLLQLLESGPRGLMRAIRRLLPANPCAELVLVIDQFEELFVLVEDDDDIVRQQFLDSLYTALSDPRSKLRVIVILRGDFYDRPLQYADFGELVRQRTEAVVPMTPTELERAIIGPAQHAGITVESELVTSLVASLDDQPGALPLLQYTLWELFEAHTNRTLTLETYHSFGGVHGTITRRADELFSALTHNEQILARQFFLRLVHVGEGAEDTRRRVPWTEIALLGDNDSTVRTIADQFGAYRLLTFDQDHATGNSTIELAHEALIREWPRLRGWLDENRDDIRMQRKLAAAVRDWQETGHDIGYLLRGARLEQFAGWAAETNLSLTQSESTFLNLSIAEKDHQRIRRRKVQRAVFATVTTVALVMTALALLANNQRDRAEGEKIRAETAEHEALRQASIGLAALAEKQLESQHTERGILLALVALEEYPYTPQAESALAHIIEQHRSYHILNGGKLHNMPFPIAAWSPDGKRVAGGGLGTPNEVVIWEADTGSVELAVDIHKCAMVDRLAWSPSGDRIATVAGVFLRTDCGTMVWDTHSGETLLQLSGYESRILSVNWSPNGASLVTGHEDGTVTIWDSQTGAKQIQLSGHTGSIHDVAFSSDSLWLATGSEDGTVRLWDVQSGTQQMVLTGTIGAVRSVAWSPDSTRLVTGGDDGLPRVWSILNGTPLFVLPGHTDRVVVVDWSLNGKRIASLGMDTNVRIWDAETGGFLLQIPNISPGVTDFGYAALSPDGNQVLATDILVQEGKVWIWDISLSVPKLFGHTLAQQFGAWSPDGTLIATSSYDGTSRIWDSITGEQQLVLKHGPANFSDWSPDGSRIVVSVATTGYEVRDIQTGDLLLEVPSPRDEEAIAARWSPDGTRVAVTGYNPSGNNPATIWDASAGDILLTLRRHDNCQQVFPEWSPDSSKIVTGCIAFGEEGKDTPAQVWDTTTGKVLMVLESEHGWTRGTTWSPDGKRIAVTYEESVVRIWDAERGDVLLTFAGHSGQVFSSAWSPDGTRIASRDLTGTVKVWDSETAQEIMSFTVPGGEGIVNWSPDGEYIIVTGGFTVPIIKHVWHSTEELIAHAYDCCVTRQLTSDERAQFGLSERAE